ncbi:hypothetical protein L6164_013349 [Bauhinia variegata]|uniref:Uncharacterized protein n=1 Tax=Bauhinia variegata TaxID=167791 RepID=A0ACB9PE92_BAUVA|nr:hypothetical protein L6164_013349 [Bauhinia variegata]
MTLGKGLILTDVLYVPKLNCNLLSAPQLIDDKRCVMQFINKACVIQDHTLRMLIGVGKRVSRLYYFHKVTEAKACRIEGFNQMDLWNRRLGHSSFQILQNLPIDSKPEGELNKSCDVRFRAKQTRDKFSLSNFCASCVFELVHCDLWNLISLINLWSDLFF